MSQIFSKLPFSASPSATFQPILVTATATPGTLVHTTPTTTTTDDEIYLYAFNTDTVARLLTIEFGGVTSPNNTIQQSIPPRQGLFLLVPGIPLSAGTSGGAVNVRAFCATGGVVAVLGYVNRIV